MRWLGIDPGASGGIAVLRSSTHWADDGIVEAHAMPDTERDCYDLLVRLAGEFPHFAFIEAVHSMPKQGVASSFKFGRSYGFLRGLLTASGIPWQEVSPQKWQRELECLTHGDKNVSKARAQMLFPHLKVTHATADALLIAEYCRRIRVREAA